MDEFYCTAQYYVQFLPQCSLQFKLTPKALFPEMFILLFCFSLQKLFRHCMYFWSCKYIKLVVVVS